MTIIKPPNEKRLELITRSITKPLFIVSPAAKPHTDLFNQSLHYHAALYVQLMDGITSATTLIKLAPFGVLNATRFAWLSLCGQTAGGRCAVCLV